MPVSAGLYFFLLTGAAFHLPLNWEQAQAITLWFSPRWITAHLLFTDYFPQGIQEVKE